MHKSTISKREVNSLTVLSIENDHLRVEIVPELGGKITSVINKKYDNEFLWSNRGLKLQKYYAGDDYDTNFWGGIDELLPNDIPETIDGIDYPDHGELWTTRLEYTLQSDVILLEGLLPLSGLYYQKKVSLADGSPNVILSYTITNRTKSPRKFLWKLHAALQIASGNRLASAARKAKIVDPDSSRFKDMGEFEWPVIEGVDASVVPPKESTMDFFYLYDSPKGEMSLVADAYRFTYEYDQRIFPYQWYFASYGQFRDHYTAILEPASAMPVSVNEAATLGQCSVLAPGDGLSTEVVIYAGNN